MKISDASLLPAVGPAAYDFDTIGSAQAIDLNIKISTACSGFGSNVEIVTGPLSIQAIGSIGKS